MVTSNQGNEPLTPRGLFGVFIRLIGIWEIAAGVYSLPTFVQNFRHYNDDYEFFRALVVTVLSAAAFRIAIGAFFLLRADWLANLVYRHRPQDLEVSQDGPSDPDSLK
jgi:hypothetical protein